MSLISSNLIRSLSFHPLDMPLLMQSCKQYGVRFFGLYRVSPKIRPSPNFKNDFNISPTLKIRPRR